MTPSHGAPPQRVCPHCATIAYSAERNCPFCGRSYRRRGVAGRRRAAVRHRRWSPRRRRSLMLVAAGQEFDRRTNRQVDSVQGQFGQDVDRLERRIQREASTERLPITPTPPRRRELTFSRRRRAEAYADPVLLQRSWPRRWPCRWAARPVGASVAAGLDRPRPPVAARSLALGPTCSRCPPAAQPQRHGGVARARRWGRRPAAATGGRRSRGCSRTSCATRPRQDPAAVALGSRSTRPSASWGSAARR